MICVPRWLVVLVVGLIVIAAMWSWRDRPEPSTIVVHRVVSVKEARRDLPSTSPGILHRVLWGEIKPSVIEQSPPGSDLRTFNAFCGPVARADSSGDSSVARGTFSPQLLLIGGVISGRSLTLHGILSTAADDRREFRLRDNHGGVEWVVHDSSVTVRERRHPLAFLDLLHVGASAGYFCTTGGGGSCGWGGGVGAQLGIP